MEKWGNLFSPAVWDWNKDGRWDLLVGEGSYSANSIHLLINKGSNDHPVFDESNRSVIAYGMGLEQISPCVVDYNGDGLPDLLVTERSGKVAVYLNNGTPWKPGETLEFDSFIKAGVPFAKNESGTKPSPMDAAKGSGLLSLGGICTITAADLNGDGLFDLIFGKSNGRIAVAYNTGTKEHPKFSNPVEITSEFKNALVTVPDNWLADSGLGRGNFLGAITLVKAEEDPGATGLVGARCLKAGYVPWLNTIMPSPNQYTPALSEWDRVMCSSISDWTLPSSPANYYHLKFPKDYKKSFPLKVKTPYVLSMRVRGTGVSEGAVYVHYYAQDTPQQGKVVRGGRNAATVVGEIKFEERKALEIMKFTVSPQWCEITKEFTVIPEKKELKDVQQIEVDAWALHISFDLAPGTGVIYIDDFKMIEK